MKNIFNKLILGIAIVSSTIIGVNNVNLDSTSKTFSPRIISWEQIGDTPVTTVNSVSINYDIDPSLLSGTFENVNFMDNSGYVIATNDSLTGSFDTADAVAAGTYVNLNSGTNYEGWGLEIKFKNAFDIEKHEIVQIPTFKTVDSVAPTMNSCDFEKQVNGDFLFSWDINPEFYTVNKNGIRVVDSNTGEVYATSEETTGQIILSSFNFDSGDIIKVKIEFDLTDTTKDIFDPNANWHYEQEYMALTNLSNVDYLMLLVDAVQILIMLIFFLLVIIYLIKLSKTKKKKSKQFKKFISNK